MREVACVDIHSLQSHEMEALTTPQRNEYSHSMNNEDQGRIQNYTLEGHEVYRKQRGGA